jgi:hypothetical protein
MEILVEQEILDRTTNVLVTPPRVQIPWVSFRALGLDIAEVTGMFDTVKLDDNDDNADVRPSSAEQPPAELNLSDPSFLNSVRDLSMLPGRMVSQETPMRTMSTSRTRSSAAGSAGIGVERTSSAIALLRSPPKVSGETQDVEMAYDGDAFMTQPQSACAGNLGQSYQYNQVPSATQPLQKRPGTKRSATGKAPATFNNNPDGMAETIMTDILADMKLVVEAKKIKVAKHFAEMNRVDDMDIDEGMSKAVENPEDSDEDMDGADEEDDELDVQEIERMFEDESNQDQGVEGHNSEHDATKDVAGNGGQNIQGLPAAAANFASSHSPASPATLKQPVSDPADEESDVSEEDGEVDISNYINPYSYMQPRPQAPLFNPLPFRPRKPGNF